MWPGRHPHQGGRHWSAAAETPRQVHNADGLLPGKNGEAGGGLYILNVTIFLHYSLFFSLTLHFTCSVLFAIREHVITWSEGNISPVAKVLLLLFPATEGKVPPQRVRRGRRVRDLHPGLSPLQEAHCCVGDSRFPS